MRPRGRPKVKYMEPPEEIVPCQEEWQTDVNILDSNDRMTAVSRATHQDSKVRRKLSIQNNGF